MGLDTSHNCWHGAYSSFHRWRVALHAALGGGDASPTNLEDAWSHGTYADQSVPINVLMNHSDCDGEIPAAMCGPLADALQALLDGGKLSNELSPFHDSPAERAVQFIAGLREAAAFGESVDFH